MCFQLHLISLSFFLFLFFILLRHLMYICIVTKPQGFFVSPTFNVNTLTLVSGHVLFPVFVRFSLFLALKTAGFSRLISVPGNSRTLEHSNYNGFAAIPTV
jgi:hypothetical protein